MELKVFSENIANNHTGHPGGSTAGVGIRHHFVGLATPPQQHQIQSTYE